MGIIQTKVTVRTTAETALAVENAARAELGSKDQMWRISMFSVSNIRQATHSIEEDHKNTVFQKIVQNSVRYQRAT